MKTQQLHDDIASFVQWQKEMDYEERAAIKEFCGNMPREIAERQAREEIFGKGEPCRSTK